VAIDAAGDWTFWLALTEARSWWHLSKMSNYHGGGRRQNNNGGVPPRWLNCPRKSEGFIADKFLVFKTPLSSRYDNFVAAEKRFYPQMIVDYVKMRNVCDVTTS